MLKLPEVADTLRSYRADPTYFHTSAWTANAVATANAAGGALVAGDYANYAAEVLAPFHGTFRGRDLYAGGFGGAKLIIAMQALDALRGGQPGAAPSESADDLERLLRVQRAVAAEDWLLDRTLPARAATSDAMLASRASAIASGVARQVEAAPRATGGSHSSAVVVVDAEGNVVAGTHTIATMPWGEGLFVGGIPLPTAALSSIDDPGVAALRMQLDVMTNTIAFDHGAPVAALAVYGAGLHPGDVQVLDAALGRGLSPEDAILAPRVGYYEFDINALTKPVDTSRSVVDPRFSPALLCTMKSRGFTLERSMLGVSPGIVDTGFPTLVTIAPGTLRGMTPELVDGVAAGE